MERLSFSDLLNNLFNTSRHGWKRDACAFLHITRPTLDRYLTLERDGKVELIPENILAQLQAAANKSQMQSSSVPATPYAMVNFLASGLCELQENIDRNGFIQAPYPVNLVRGLNLACALNITFDRNYPTSLTELLRVAATPLYNWCIEYEGERAEEFGAATLIRNGEVTSECFELAGLLNVDPEHYFYHSLRAACTELGDAEGQKLYVAWRRTVIDLPVVDGFTKFLENTVLRCNLGLTQRLAEIFYEDLPFLHADHGNIAICPLTKIRLRRLQNEWISDSRNPRAAHLIREHGPIWRSYLPRMQELKRPARLFWTLPGIEEISLYESATRMGYQCELWPKFDAVDIVIKHPSKPIRFAVDVKEHRSPISLGRTFEGFKAFKRHQQALVVPDYLVDLNPAYYQQFERSRRANFKSPVVLLSASQFTQLLEDKR